MDCDSSSEGISDQGWRDFILTSLQSREEAAAASALPITRMSAREVMFSAPFQHPALGPASDRMDPAPESRSHGQQKTA